MFGDCGGTGDFTILSSGLFIRGLLDLGVLGDFTVLSFIFLSSTVGLFLLPLSISTDSGDVRFFLDPGESGDLAKPLLIALGVTMEEDDDRFWAFVGVLGGGCGDSSFVCSVEELISSSS